MGAVDDGVSRGGYVVPSTFVHLLYEHLERRGHDATRVLGQPRPAPGERGLGHYPLASWARLLDRAASHLDDPLLGLHLGRDFAPRHAGVLAHVLAGCDTTADAMRQYERFEPLFYGAPLVRYRTEGDSLVIEWSGEHGRPTPLVAECAIAALYRFCQEVVGPEAVGLEEICFVHRPPTNREPYERYFGCPVRFGRRATLLRARAGHSVPLRGANPLLRQMMQEQAEALLEELGGTDPFEREVRAAIVRLLRDGEPTLARVASALGTSPRTLQRRLHDRDGGFRALVGDCRRRLAERDLRDSDLPIAQIAQRLGFSEQSAFQRSFKRWTGQTPRRFREARARRRVDRS